MRQKLALHLQQEEAEMELIRGGFYTVVLKIKYLYKEGKAEPVLADSIWAPEENGSDNKDKTQERLIFLEVKMLVIALAKLMM